MTSHSTESFGFVRDAGFYDRDGVLPEVSKLSRDVWTMKDLDVALVLLFKFVTMKDDWEPCVLLTEATKMSAFESKYYDTRDSFLGLKWIGDLFQSQDVGGAKHYSESVHIIGRLLGVGGDAGDAGDAAAYSSLLEEEGGAGFLGQLRCNVINAELKGQDFYATFWKAILERGTPSAQALALWLTIVTPNGDLASPELKAFAALDGDTKYTLIEAFRATTSRHPHLKVKRALRRSVYKRILGLPTRDAVYEVMEACFAPPIGAQKAAKRVRV